MQTTTSRPTSGTETPHINLKQFSDEELRELHATTETNSGNADWDQVAREIQADIVDEAHERALSIQVRYVTITCRREGWSDNQRHVGTLVEFMETFGLRLEHVPGADAGHAAGTGACGHTVQLEWTIELATAATAGA